MPLPRMESPYPRCLAAAFLVIAAVGAANARELWTSGDGEKSVSLKTSLKSSSLLSHAPDDASLFPERDIAAKERWYHYLADVNLSSGTASNSIPGGVTKVYSNGVATIKDPWGGEYKYVSKPPYLSYELKSNNLD